MAWTVRQGLCQGFILPDLCGRKAKFLEEEKKEHLAFRMFRGESESCKRESHWFILALALHLTKVVLLGRGLCDGVQSGSHPGIHRPGEDIAAQEKKCSFAPLR